MKRGFTLVELLVVISIIGMLSSVVMLSLNKVREKARASFQNQTAAQYIRALNLVYQKDGRYPYDSADVALGDTPYYCLSDDLSNCGIHNESSPSVEISAKVSEFYPDLPNIGPVKFIFYAEPLNGPTYACGMDPPNAPNKKCKNFFLQWWLEGEYFKCADGAFTVKMLGTTFCTYTFYND